MTTCYQLYVIFFQDKSKISDALMSYNKAFFVQIGTLKKQQIDAILAVLSGNDCICSLQTGYGKSLAYELLTLIEPACLVIVVVPLNAIIEQQLQITWQYGLFFNFISFFLLKPPTCNIKEKVL
jgi:superfamily II DNA or RNA helicase